MQTELTGVEVGKDISRLLNRGPVRELGDLVDTLSNDHRTLQQSLMREVVWPLLSIWAKAFEDGRFDARNDQTVALAAEIVAEFEESAIFPFI